MLNIQHSGVQGLIPNLQGGVRHLVNALTDALHVVKRILRCIIIQVQEGDANAAGNRLLHVGELLLAARQDVGSGLVLALLLQAGRKVVSEDNIRVSKGALE